MQMAACLLAAVLVSCEKDDTLQYDNATMGNIVDGRFVSDQGNVFNIVDQACEGNLQDMTRAFVVCDVLNKTAGGADNEYDVRLTGLASVLEKEVVYHDNTNEDMLVQDPVHVEYAWVAGGYINMYVMFPMQIGSQTKHLINLVHEGFMTDPQTGEEITGTYRFTLRHNSFGDKVDSLANVDYVIGGGYVSFPLSTYVLADEAQFTIDWVWSSEAEDGTSAENITKSLTGVYSSESFHHK